MTTPPIIEASDIACASAAADLFGGNGLTTNQQVALVAQLFADHRAASNVRSQDKARLDSGLINIFGTIHKKVDLRAAIDSAIKYEAAS